MSELFFIVLLLAATVYVLLKNKNKLKMLKISKMIGIVLSFVVSVGIAASLIYYGGNWIAGKIPYAWIGWVVFIFITVIVITGINLLFNRLVEKIINNDGSLKLEKWRAKYGALAIALSCLCSLIIG
ncbi:hypothetical protein [Lentibacillus jeotgali]|uniref:hypothetical protein n=1 Tax=Lentibacillus jeotgali TaxID=558169 RepID=UPI0002628F91|nr:hypothetical protein [Lentibacillus jeotgali]